MIIFFPWRKSFGQVQSDYAVDVAFPNLSFNQPVGIVNSGDGSNRLFVIEQAGIIRFFENSKAVGASRVFLDIRSKVLFGGEQGLLGLAFHPNYAANGHFFINYVAANPLRTVIAEYSVSPNNPNQALSDSEKILLEVNQPFSNHKGGQISFGPDGYLYVGLGDGGSGGDPFAHGQNRASLLGKILRIDVDLPSLGQNYSIPQENPYFANTLGYREEIYAYGFRNPWRFSFDIPTGRLWAGDVGQDQREEIDIVEKGKNYGWNAMEGSLNFAGENISGLELPIWEYGRSEGIAVIGGYVYHGSTLAGLTSKYIYGDYGSGKVWALDYNGVAAPANDLLVDTNLNISSFGVDERNELYFCALDGKIYVLIHYVSSTPSPTLQPTTAPTSTLNPTSTSIASPTPTPATSFTPSPTASSSLNPTIIPSPTTIIPEYPLIAILIIALLTTITLVMFLYRVRKKK